MEASSNGGAPIAGWFVIEHAIKMDDSGVPPISGNHHIVKSVLSLLSRATQWLTKGPIGDLHAVEAHSVSLSSFS